MNKYYGPLLPNQTYHLFNRAIGNEQLFLSNENYKYFLKKYAEHMNMISKTYCYCLLPNHFHFMMRINETDTIAGQYLLSKKKAPQSLDDLYLSDFIMERFSNFLNGYTKAFNRMYGRKGGLFLDFTRRSNVDNDSSFSNVIHYVHANPVHHGLCKNIEDWKFSSYASILSNLPTKLLRDEVIEWFGSKEQYIQFHKQPIYFKPVSMFD